MMYIPYRKNGGAAILTAVLFFLFILMTIVLGVATPILKQVQISKDLFKSKEGFYLAEGGLNDGLYRIKSSMSVASGETLVVNGYTTALTITTTSNGKTITAQSDRDGFIRRVEAKVATSDGASFNYAMQTGNGGFNISGGSTINGNVYANGNIVGDGGATITGSATAANSSALSADITNTAPNTPPNSVIFGNSNSTQDFAQSFTVTNTGALNKVRLYIRKTTGQSPGDLTARISSDNGGRPAADTLDSVIVSTTLVLASNTNYGWVDVVFPSYIQLAAGETYWLVLDGGSNSSRYYTMAANTALATNAAKVGTFSSGTWANTSPSGLDAYFEVYTGGITSQIYGVDGSWDLTIGGDSWAHTIDKTNTSGTLYCQTGTANANGKVCNTIRSDPPAQQFSISDAQIQQWIDDAGLGWTLNESLTVGWQGTTTGPLVINGDLLINGGGIMTLKGTVYVNGNVTVTGGGSVRLSSSYGSTSGVLVASGRIAISGNGQFSGSGQAGSYPILVSTSMCPMDAGCNGANALSLTGGSGAVVLVAPYGTMQMNGGSGAKAMTAYKIVISGGGSVNYDSGLVDLTLTSGPSGSWAINSWKEVQ